MQCPLAHSVGKQNNLGNMKQLQTIQNLRYLQWWILKTSNGYVVRIDIGVSEWVYEVGNAVSFVVNIPSLFGHQVAGC